MSAVSAETETVEPAERVRLERIPIEQLTSHPGNVRQDLKVSKEFRASVLRRMLTPLLVVELPDGGYKVFDGNRRLTVLVEAEVGSVLCLVFEDVDAAEEYLAMTTTARQREGLSDTEVGLALFGAAELGASVKRMAEATGLRQKDVRTAVRFSQSETLRQATQEGDNPPALNLDHMAALVEFEGDPEAVKVLTQAARGSNFEYALRRLRNDREEAKKLAKEREEYVAAGIRVIDSREDLPETAERVWRLKGSADAEKLDEEEHGGCPGHVVAPAEWGGSWEPYCLDWAAHGHHLRWPPKEEEKYDPVAARVVYQGNKDWQAATAVRRDWLAQFTRRKSWPKELQEVMGRFAAGQVLLGGYIITNGLNSADALELALKWLGLDDGADWEQCAKVADKAPSARMPLLHFVAVAAPMERQAGAKDRRAWRTDRHAYTDGLRERIGAYLRALAELGYELSPVEQAVAEGRTYDPFPQSSAQPAPEPLKADDEKEQEK